MSRAGRQGKKGTYQMIVSQDELSQKQLKLVDNQQLFETLKNYWKVNASKYDAEMEAERKKYLNEH